MASDWTSVRRESARGFAVRLFHVCLLVYAASLSLSWCLARLFPPNIPRPGLRLPPAFLLSSGLLVAVSVYLHRALSAVRIERQRPFRRRMRAALALGALFIGVQGYGLWWLLSIQERTRSAVETGAAAFVFVLAVLHAMHVSVALLILVYATLKAHCDRYDHEYYWGVTFCSWLWHAMGTVWLAILGVFAIAT